MAAIREAILNAVIHRDYSFYTESIPIQLDMFTDRLEIHSPGSLYGRMTVEQLGVARTDIRNPALAVMAESLTEAENRYSGIPTMRREMKAQGLPEPVFENRRNEFVVIFYNEPISSMPSDDEMHRDEDSILTFCKIPRSRQEITEFLGLKTSGYVVKRYITPLIQAGKLQMTIPDQPRSRYQKYIHVE